MKKKYTILLHTIYWTFTSISMGLQTIHFVGKEPINLIILDYIIYTLSGIIIFYSLYLFISKKYLKKKYAKYFVILGLVFTVIFSSLITFIYAFFVTYDLFALNGNEFLLEYSKLFFQFLETNFIFALSGSLIKIALLWYESMVKQKELEKQMITNELALLKTQINPNFLVSALTELKNRTEQSPDTAIYIIESLSEIMSYMLYETSAEKVLLDKEINCINKYLNLKRLRYSSDFIRFNVTGDTNGIFIPTMLFMPFVENAFKYGDDFSQAPGITINLDVRENNLSFEIINYANDNTNKNKSGDGINLKSVIRHLDLLFGKNYSLNLINNDKQYFTKLNINLTA